IAGVQQRVPLNGTVAALPYPPGYGAGPASIPPIGAALGVPSPFMQNWGAGGFGEPALGAHPADPYAAYSPPYSPPYGAPCGAPNPYAMSNGAPSPAFGSGYVGRQPDQYTPAPVQPYGYPNQGGFGGSEPASPFASPIDGNPFAQPVESSP